MRSICSYLAVNCTVKDTTSTVCPRTSDPFYIVTHHTKLVTTSWTYCMLNEEINPDLEGKNKEACIVFIPYNL